MSFGQVIRVITHKYLKASEYVYPPGLACTVLPTAAAVACCAWPGDVARWWHWIQASKWFRVGVEETAICSLFFFFCVCVSSNILTAIICILSL